MNMEDEEAGMYYSGELSTGVRQTPYNSRRDFTNEEVLTITADYECIEIETIRKCLALS